MKQFKQCTVNNLVYTMYVEDSSEHFSELYSECAVEVTSKGGHFVESFDILAEDGVNVDEYSGTMLLSASDLLALQSFGYKTSEVE